MFAPWKEGYDKFSVLKSRDITFPTNVCIVKTMIFPVVMYGCENWTIKKAECRRIDAFKFAAGEDSWESLGLQKIKPVNPRGNQPWIFIGSLMLKLKFQYFGHQMRRADSLKKTLILGKIKSRRRKMAEDEMIRYHRLNGHEFEQTLKIDQDRGTRHAAVHGTTKSWTWLSSWTTTTTELWEGKSQAWRGSQGEAKGKARLP